MKVSSVISIDLNPNPKWLVGNENVEVLGAHCSPKELRQSPERLPEATRQNSKAEDP